MKSVILAVIILCSVTLSVIGAAIYSGHVLDKFTMAIDDAVTGTSEAAANTEKIEKQYQRIKPFLSLFACDSEAREIETYIEDIKSASLENDEEALTTAKSRLKLHVKQLRRLSGFSIEAIF